MKKTGLCSFAVCVFFTIAAMVTPADDGYEEARKRMVEDQIKARGVRDERVLAAMEKVPRHLFVPRAVASRAYSDAPLPIGRGQTISQPYIVAYMTETLELAPGDKVLEIGTGSGYQAAVLSELVKSVYSIEILEQLAYGAKDRLEDLGYSNVEVRWGDGYNGWSEEAPFDAIMVTAAPPEIPKALMDQLAVGGKLVAPVGTYYQHLMLITKTGDGFIEKKLIPVRFVPMVKAK
jgi:protein-L-isoaspartate(D-aspartate) O-methyltransferase